MKKLFAFFVLAITFLVCFQLVVGNDEFDVVEDEGDFEPDDVEDTVVITDDDEEGTSEYDDSESILVTNAKKRGVTVMPSGLQYRVLKAAKGAQAAPVDQYTYCKVHYEGKLESGDTFDSSYARGEPIIVTPGQLIPGWQEALTMMREGDKWELVIPSKLAYGAKGIEGRIPPDSTLVFTVELLEVNPEVTLWQEISRVMSRPFPGLPFSNWQIAIFGSYILLRFATRRIGSWAASSSGGVTCEARHILVDSEKRCNELKQEIKKGASFETIAQGNSKCPSGKKGGKLGKFKQGQMVPEFDKVCFDVKTKIGEVVGPVKTQFGWHLIQVDSREGLEEESKKEK